MDGGWGVEWGLGGDDAEEFDGVAGDDGDGGQCVDGSNRAGDAGVGGVDEDAEFVAGFLEGLGTDAGGALGLVAEDEGDFVAGGERAVVDVEDDGGHVGAVVRFAIETGAELGVGILGLEVDGRISGCGRVGELGVLSVGGEALCDFDGAAFVDAGGADGKLDGPGTHGAGDDGGHGRELDGAEATGGFFGQGFGHGGLLRWEKNKS